MKKKDFLSAEAFFLYYFFITFFGGRLVFENYLVTDKLPIVYSMITGLVAALLAGVIIYFVRNKTIPAKIVTSAILLMLVILINIILS